MPQAYQKCQQWLLDWFCPYIIGFTYIIPLKEENLETPFFFGSEKSPKVNLPQITELLGGDSDSQEIIFPIAFESCSHEHVTRNSRTASPGGKSPCSLEAVAKVQSPGQFRNRLLENTYKNMTESLPNKPGLPESSVLFPDLGLPKCVQGHEEKRSPGVIWKQKYLSKWSPPPSQPQG